VVTGASRGLGAEFAEQLAARRYDLILTARDQARLEELAQRLRDQHGVEVEVFVGDLCNEETLGVLEQRVAEDDELALLVNNAGFGTWGRFVDLDLQRELEMIRLHVCAMVRLTKAALSGMVRRGQGGVINVSSISAFFPQVFSATYNATKAYIRNFSECLHEELRGTGVTVQVLCPGLMHTEIFARAGVETQRIPFFLWMYPKRCVRFSLAALRKKKAVCVPNFGYRFLVLLLRLLPRCLVRRYVSWRFGQFDKLALESAPSVEEAEQR
jgi:short-subunit dehydrogenase